MWLKSSKISVNKMDLKILSAKWYPFLFMPRFANGFFEQKEIHPYDQVLPSYQFSKILYDMYEFNCTQKLLGKLNRQL